MQCLDENTVAAFVDRKLDEADRKTVEAHLDACPDCLAIVCEAARTAVGAKQPEPASSSEPESPEMALTIPDDSNPSMGKAIDAFPRRGGGIARYTLLEMVGQGAMGSVFEAHDPQLDRRVALKLVRRDRLALPGARKRLAREARAMA